MKLVIPKTIPNVHLLQQDKSAQNTPPVSGAYPIFYDGARSSKKPVHHYGEFAPNIVKLGDLLSTSCQFAYKSLIDMIELLPKMNNVEKKQMIISTCLRIRELFYKLTVLVEFLSARKDDIILANVRMILASFPYTYFF